MRKPAFTKNTNMERHTKFSNSATTKLMTYILSSGNCNNVIPIYLGIAMLTSVAYYLSTIDDFQPSCVYKSPQPGHGVQRIPFLRTYKVSSGRLLEQRVSSQSADSATGNPNPKRPSGTGMAHRMCACGRCYHVWCSFNKTGHLTIKTRNLKRGPGVVLNSSISTPVDDVSYFHVTVTWKDRISAMIVSDLDRRLDTLQTIRAESNATFNISIKLIHANKSSAYGLDDPQWKELNCVLCLGNSTCSLMVTGNFPEIPPKERSRLRWVRRDESDSNDSETCASYGNACYHLAANRPDSLLESWQFNKSAEECFRNRKFVFLGDSHAHMIGLRLAPWPEKGKWQIRMDGVGIYHNWSPDRNMTAYLARETPSRFQKGGMLRYLSDGTYQDLQDRENFDGWIISSGHWDLRDVTIDEYLVHLRELFMEWNPFRKANKDVLMYWNGVPPYSYKRGLWKGCERRTNIKIALGDLGAKELCAEFNVTYIPFFDIALPFYTESCDTHHYLCPRRPSPVGEAQLDVLLSTICS